MTAKVRVRLRFTGRVQGVGFRWRARHAAQLLDLTGWVENRSDDSVEMEVQGLRDDVERLPEILRQGRFIEIDSVERTELAPDPEERGFSVY